MTEYKPDDYHSHPPQRAMEKRQVDPFHTEEMKEIAVDMEFVLADTRTTKENS
jgi:hypothetical protein